MESESKDINKEIVTCSACNFTTCFEDLLLHSCKETEKNAFISDLEEANFLELIRPLKPVEYLEIFGPAFVNDDSDYSESDDESDEDANDEEKKPAVTWTSGTFAEICQTSHLSEEVISTLVDFMRDDRMKPSQLRKSRAMKKTLESYTPFCHVDRQIDLSSIPEYADADLVFPMFHPKDILELLCEKFGDHIIIDSLNEDKMEHQCDGLLFRLYTAHIRNSNLGDGCICVEIFVDGTACGYRHHELPVYMGLANVDSSVLNSPENTVLVGLIPNIKALKGVSDLKTTHARHLLVSQCLGMILDELAFLTNNPLTVTIKGEKKTLPVKLLNFPLDMMEISNGFGCRSGCTICKTWFPSLQADEFKNPVVFKRQKPLRSRRVSQEDAIRIRNSKRSHTALDVYAKKLHQMPLFHPILKESNDCLFEFGNIDDYLDILPDFLISAKVVEFLRVGGHFCIYSGDTLHIFYRGVCSNCIFPLVMKAIKSDKSTQKYNSIKREIVATLSSFDPPLVDSKKHYSFNCLHEDLERAEAKHTKAYLQQFPFTLKKSYFKNDSLYDDVMNLLSLSMKVSAILDSDCMSAEDFRLLEPGTSGIYDLIVAVSDGIDLPIKERFSIPKLHMMLHYPLISAIHGPLKNCGTWKWEAAHKPNTKVLFNFTNKQSQKDVDTQIMECHERQMGMDVIKSEFSHLEIGTRGRVREALAENISKISSIGLSPDGNFADFFREEPDEEGNFVHSSYYTYTADVDDDVGSLNGKNLLEDCFQQFPKKALTCLVDSVFSKRLKTTLHANSWVAYDDGNTVAQIHFILKTFCDNDVKWYLIVNNLDNKQYHQPFSEVPSYELTDRLCAIELESVTNRHMVVEALDFPGRMYLI
eukprot:TRINITY_DN388_c0_g1_i5.p1 TRINITY_DN388_c0_g1~~TRINITY_DN388_c0_g1_i5.p1  ORF type:complete len:871 (+),score=192.51 TRINITY_DN388_c0_g1_i5:113-2725(+)